MGIKEVLLLIAAQQLAQAAANFCAAGEAWATHPLAKAGFRQGGQVLTNASAIAGFGIPAAIAEMTTIQTAETGVASGAKGVPLPKV